MAATLLTVTAAVAQRPDTTSTASTPPGARTRLTPAPAPLPADLQIVKTVGTAPTGGGTGTFNLVITNLGPGAAVAPIIVNDSLTGPATIVSSSVPCTGIGGTSVSCSLSTSLNAGQSTTITLTVGANAGAFGMIQNCATVKSQSKDPKDQNNRDCTCMDFKRCFDTVMDVSTGTLNGTAIAIGSSDSHWTVKPPGGNTAPAVATNDALPPWVTPPPGTQWISSSTSANAVGSYVYSFNFNLGTQWPSRICTLSLQWAADNNMTLNVDNNSAFASTSTPNAFSSFNTLHNASTGVPSSGQHVLTATVYNSGGPTALLVSGKINCVCKKPNPIGEPSTSTQ
jgi:hypothetical protein